MQFNGLMGNPLEQCLVDIPKWCPKGPNLALFGLNKAYLLVNNPCGQEAMQEESERGLKKARAGCWILADFVGGYWPICRSLHAPL